MSQDRKEEHDGCGCRRWSGAGLETAAPEEERAENCRLGSVLLLSLLTTCKNIWPLSSTQTAGNQLVLGAFL